MSEEYEIQNVSRPASNGPSTADEIGQLARDLLDAWNAHDVERVKTFYAQEYEGTDVGQAEPQRGPEGVGQTVLSFLEAFPDLLFVEEETIVQGNRAVLIWTAHGTHRGKLIRIPPTGREVAVRGTSVLTIENGKVTRGLYIWDVAGLLRSIGLLPAL